MKQTEEAHQNRVVPLNAEGTATFDGAASFAFQHRLLRLTWNLTWKLFGAWTPPPLHRWRIWLVNLFGGQVAPTCFIYGSVRIWYPPFLKMEHAATLGPGVDCYTMGRIALGPYAVVSQRAFLCTGSHNIQRADFQIAARPIHIGANAWVAAEAFVGPGVTIGEGAVLAARGAAFKDLQPWTVYLGNPAVAIKARSRFEREVPRS